MSVRREVRQSSIHQVRDADTRADRVCKHSHSEWERERALWGLWGRPFHNAVKQEDFQKELEQD